MEAVNRLNTCSYKWDGLKREFGEDGLLAMWVADMDFPSPDCAIKALEKYIRHPMGYFKTPDSYYDAIIRWEKERHGYEIERDWICVTPGIVPALHWAVRSLTKPGETVMVSTPVYYPFMNAVVNAGERALVKNELKKVNGRYVFDVEDFEEKITKNSVKLYILCNPHNPVGRVWTGEELKTILDICKKHGVVVIADEIHQDIINPKLGRKKVTAATVGDYNDIIITMASASKSFNIAAVQNSFIIIPNKSLRDNFNDYLEKNALDDVNAFGHIATEAVLCEGKPWLDDAVNTIFGNYEYIKTRFADECPEVKIEELEGTYLLWMDLGVYCKNVDEVKELLQNKCRLALDYGEWFGSDQHSSYARMNIATSRDNVKEACDRIIKALKG